MAGKEPVLPVGATLAGYRIERILGTGSYGTVYLAEELNPQLERTVALKVLRPTLGADASFRERFFRESRLVARLEPHPAIVSVYNAGEEQGLLWIASRFVDGTDLRVALETHGRLAPSLAGSLIEQVGGGLDVAHADGIVHRDVKPANLLLSSDLKRAYLADFGMSKNMESEAENSLTRVGQFVGTVKYAAPEQFGGEEITGRADQYSLACVAYEILTGQAPFDGDMRAIMFAHAEKSLPDIRSVVPSLSRSANEVIQRAAAKDPGARYPSCTAFATDLVDALRPGADETRVGTVRRPPPTPVQRRPGPDRPQGPSRAAASSTSSSQPRPSGTPVPLPQRTIVDPPRSGPTGVPPPGSASGSWPSAPSNPPGGPVRTPPPGRSVSASTTGSQPSGPIPRGPATHASSHPGPATHAASRSGGSSVPSSASSGGAMPRPRSTGARVGLLAAIAVPVLAVVTVLGLCLTGDGCPWSSAPPYPDEAEQRLLDVLPAAIRGTCERDTPTADEDQVVAAVRCNANDERVDAVSFRQFADRARLDQAFSEALRGTPVVIDDATNCAQHEGATNDYRTEDSLLGRVACYRDGGSSHLVWTTDELRVFGQARQDGRFDGDLYDWWAGLLDVVPEASDPDEELPDLAPEASDPDEEVRTFVPAALEVFCEPFDTGGATRASLTCQPQALPADFVSYDYYDSVEQLRADYDALRGDYGVGADVTDFCPTEGEWFEGEEVTPGRLACAFDDELGTVLFWTDERVNVITFAARFDGDAEALREWWRDNGMGPLVP